MYLCNFFCSSENGKSDVTDCYAKVWILFLQNYESKVKSYSNFEIQFLQIWTYPSAGNSQTEVHCKSRGNIVLHVEQRRAVSSTPVPAQGSQEDATLVSQPGRCCGNPVAQLLCCLKTSFRNQNYLLSVLLVSQNHPLQIQLHFEQPQSLEKVLASPPLTQVLHFTRKLLTCCPETFTWLVPLMGFLTFRWISHYRKDLDHWKKKWSLPLKRDPFVVEKTKQNNVKHCCS